MIKRWIQRLVREEVFNILSQLGIGLDEKKRVRIPGEVDGDMNDYLRDIIKKGKK